MDDRWCRWCNGWGVIRYPYGRAPEMCNCGGPYRGDLTKDSQPKHSHLDLDGWDNQEKKNHGEKV